MADIDRIKRNIDRMLVQNAPEADIDAYVASEGVTLDQLKTSSAAQPEQQQNNPPSNSVGGMLAATGVGLGKGLIGLAGLPGDAAAFLGDARDKYITNPIRNALGLEQVDLSGQHPARNFGSESIQKGVESLTGEFRKPQTTAEEYAQTFGEFLPAAAAGPGGIARRVATQAFIPAVTSEAAGQLTRGTEAEPYARFAGAMAGPGVVAAGRRLATPFPASAERAAMTSALEGEGVQLTAGQKTGSRPLQWIESTAGDMPLSGGKARSIIDAQGEQFTSAALKRVGEDAQRATPEVIDGAFKRIGQQFDDLASRNWIEADKKLALDLTKANKEYTQLVPASQRAPVIEDTLSEILNQVRKGGNALPGEAYKVFRERLGRVGRSTSDNQAREAISNIQHALDDAMERTLAKRNPADMGAWKEARREYRNMLVIEKAATSAGENAALGLISPSALRNATVNQGRRAYARGQGDFAELARSGEAVMKPLPNSGSAPRAFAMAIPAIITSALTGGADAGALAAASTAAPGVLGRGILSKPAQTYLGNQAFPPLSQLDARLRQLMLMGPAATQAYQSR